MRIPLIFALFCALIPPVCPADIDGNGRVDTVDLRLLLAAWGPCDPNAWHAPPGMEVYLRPVASPIAPRDTHGTVVLTPTTWPELQQAALRPLELKELVIVDLAGNTIIQGGGMGSAEFKGDDFVLMNGRIDGQVKLDEACQYWAMRDLEGVIADGETFIRSHGVADGRIERVVVTGEDGSVHAFDFARGAVRLHVEDVETAGHIRYSFYFDGNSSDVWIKNCLLLAHHAEHALRAQHLAIFNVEGGRIRRGNKTAVTIRRGSRHGSLIGVDIEGSIALGPDPVRGDIYWWTRYITVAGCRVDTSGDNSDRPMVFWPRVEGARVIKNEFNDPEAEAQGRGFLVVIDERQGRTAAPVAISDNTYNGKTVGASAVDAPEGIVRDE